MANNNLTWPIIDALQARLELGKGCDCAVATECETVIDSTRTALASLVTQAPGGDVQGTIDVLSDIAWTLATVLDGDAKGHNDPMALLLTTAIKGWRPPGRSDDNEPAPLVFRHASHCASLDQTSLLDSQSESTPNTPCNCPTSALELVIGAPIVYTESPQPTFTLPDEESHLEFYIKCRNCDGPMPSKAKKMVDNCSRQLAAVFASFGGGSLTNIGTASEAAWAVSYPAASSSPIPGLRQEDIDQDSLAFRNGEAFAGHLLTAMVRAKEPKVALENLRKAVHVLEHLSTEMPDRLSFSAAAGMLVSNALTMGTAQ